MEPLGAGTEIQNPDLDRGTRSFRGSTPKTWCLFACGSAGCIVRLAARTFTAQNSVASFYAYG